jgi:hypothetical protein
MTICALDPEYQLKPEEVVSDLPFFDIVLDDTQPIAMPDFTHNTLTRIAGREIERAISYTRQETVRRVLAAGPRRPVAMIGVPVGHGYSEVPDKVLKARRVDEATIQIPQVVVQKDNEDEIDRLIAIWNEDARPKQKHFKRLRKACRLVSLAITIAFKEN